MGNARLYIVMVGLPARGKSTIANRLKDSLIRDRIPARIFNNGELRRRLVHVDTTDPDFYNPKNGKALALREEIAQINIQRAKQYLKGRGQVAILDATNVSLARRSMITSMLQDHPILFIECINEDKEILEASIRKKITHEEFNHLDKKIAFEKFLRRIDHYTSIYFPLGYEKAYLKLDSLNNHIVEEEIPSGVPYYDRIRDFLVTDFVRNLFLIRHGETTFNLENRIGGDSSLTDKGWIQAKAMAEHFRNRRIPFIFTSRKKRTIESAQPIQRLQKECVIVPLKEFDEIDSGVCECMSYEEIREQMPAVYQDRKGDKYNYVYEGGEGYVTMKERVDRGVKKALFFEW